MPVKAQGGERELTKDDRVSIIRGGQKIGYFMNYPNASGSEFKDE